MPKTNGIVLYSGASRLDGKPIVVILTGLARKSSNPKTGNMLQTYIIRADIDPVNAHRTDQDVSVCGDCPLRHGRCYVRLYQAPLGVYRAYRRGSYAVYNPTIHNALIRGRSIRFGAYGDPTAAPYRVWSNLARLADSWTGYTHQWRKRKFWRFRALVMASCETRDDAIEAQASDWRTFRTAPDDVLSVNEITCPAAANPGRITCQQCTLCAGAHRHARNIAIRPHGGAGVMNRWKQTTGT